MAGLPAGAPIQWTECHNVFSKTDVAMLQTMDDLRHHIVKRSKTIRSGATKELTGSAKHEVKHEVCCATAEATAVDLAWSDASEGFVQKKVYEDHGIRFDNSGKLLAGVDPTPPSGRCGHFHRHTTHFGDVCAGCGVCTNIFDINATMDEATHADDCRKRISTFKRDERMGSYFCNSRGYRGSDDKTQALMNAKKKEEAKNKKTTKATQPLLDWRNGARTFLINNEMTETFSMPCSVFQLKGDKPIKTVVNMPKDFCNAINTEDTPVIQLFDQFARQLVELEEREACDILGARVSEEEKMMPVKAVEVRGDLQIVHSTGYPHIKLIFTQLARYGQSTMPTSVPEELRRSFNAICRILDGKCQLASSQPPFSQHDTRVAIAKLLKHDPYIPIPISSKCQTFLLEMSLTPEVNESEDHYCRRAIDTFLNTAPGKIHRRGVKLKNRVELWDHINSVLNSE